METHETPPEGDEELRAEMSAADINDLPDSDFAYIESGGEKDDEGKTVPRSLRHFPIHDAAHVRNALARASQSPFGEKAMPKIKAAAEKFGIDVADDSQRANPALVAAARRKKDRHRAVPLMPEVRHFRADGLEVRSNAKTDEIVITGAPIVYERDYQVTDMLGQFTERMAPGVAKDVLPKADVRFLFNHDGLPLARTAAGTMALQDSDSELRFTACLDARQQLANDLAIAIQRGDVSQMSCGFIVAEDRWSEDWEDRTIVRFDDLLDVSAVTYPASPTTSIEVAQRMALRMPIESGARVRKAYVALRAGKVLSATNQDKLLTAVGSLHDVLSGAGVDVSQIGGDADDAAALDADVSSDGSTGGNDTAESGVGADGFTADQTRSSEPGEPIQYLAKAAIDQAWLESLVEKGEGLHGSARKRAA